jgi:stage V sporulation protein AC
MQADKSGKSQLPTDLEVKKTQLFKRHQDILVKEAEAKNPQDKNRYLQERIAIEKQQQSINDELYKAYNKRVKDKPEPIPYLKNLLWAICVGGAICTIGQALLMWFQNMGLDQRQAGAAVTCIIVVTTGIFTGIGIFDELGRRAGAGTIVPVTGFANSIVAAALEFKHEGIVYGVGAKLFTIAGPVIVYGTLTSMIIGLIYWIFGL